MAREYTNMDTNQIVRSQHDESHDAQRVTIVGGDFGIAEAVKESLKDLKIEIPTAPQVVKQEQPFVIEKEVIVKEYEVLKVPEIIKEYEVKIVEIEKPIVVYETKLIEVPVIQKEIEYVDRQVIVKEVKDYDKYVKALLIVQVLGLLATIVKLFL
jgi:hypothetical protein